MDKLLRASHPVICFITGPSECGKTCFLINLKLNFLSDSGNLYP